MLSAIIGGLVVLVVPAIYRLSVRYYKLYKMRVTKHGKIGDTSKLQVARALDKTLWSRWKRVLSDEIQDSVKLF